MAAVSHCEAFIMMKRKYYDTARTYKWSVWPRRTRRLRRRSASAVAVAAATAYHLPLLSLFMGHTVQDGRTATATFSSFDAFVSENAFLFSSSSFFYLPSLVICYACLRLYNCSFHVHIFIFTSLSFPILSSSFLLLLFSALLLLLLLCCPTPHWVCALLSSNSRVESSPVQSNLSFFLVELIMRLSVHLSSYLGAHTYIPTVHPHTIPSFSLLSSSNSKQRAFVPLLFPC